MEYMESIKEIEKAVDDCSDKVNNQLRKQILKKNKALEDSKTYINNIYENYLKELNQLVGLDNVKDEIKKMINYLLFVQKTNGKVKLDWC